MFKLLKKLFSSKEEPPIELKFEEIDEYIISIEKPIIDQLNIDIKDISTSFSSQISKINEKIENLKNSKLPNPDITSKEKNYLDGNREFYTNAVSMWVNSLKLDQELNLQNIKTFNDEFDQKLEELNKKTVRSYTILQEFLSNESAKVADSIREINNINLKIKDILKKENMISLEGVKSKINEINTTNKLNQDLAISIKSEEEKLKNININVEKLDNEILKFKQSPSYIEYKKSKEELKSLQIELKSIEDKLSQSFSILERPLKKYSHTHPEHKNLISQYLVSPLPTLLKDSEYTISKILDDLNNLIENGTILFDLPKKIKIYTEIARVSKKFLEEFKLNSSNITSKIVSLEKSIKENTVLSEEQILLDKKSEFERKSSEIIKEIERINKSSSNVDINKLIESIQTDLKSIQKREVSIKYNNQAL
tara:strand:- start:503 stop:1777 length:1275 start_codon:yes stop_codon:yes gene_type:complete